MAVSIENEEDVHLPSITVRNLPEDLHRRIRLYAAEHGLSAEAAVRRLLDEATRPAGRLGDVIVAYARARAVDFPETPRDRSPAILPDLCSQPRGSEVPLAQQERRQGRGAQ